METEITYKVSKQDFDEVVKNNLQELQKEVVLARYRDRYIGVDSVAEIHNVHRDTVIKYAKARLIPYTRNGKLYKFCLSDVLEFDFKALRKEN